MSIEKEGPSEDPSNKKEDKINRREFLKRGAMALGGVVVASTGIEEFAEAGEKIISSEDLPLPDLKLDDLSDKKLLSFASDLLSKGSSYEQIFEKLNLVDKKKVAELLYYRNNLVLRAIRARLLGWREDLNSEQAKKFDRYTGDLNRYGILLYGRKDFSKWINGQEKDELAEIYSYEEQMYDSYRQKKKKVELPKEKIFKTEKKEIKESGLKEKEKTKRLLDKFGYPVGIRFNHKFFEHEPNYSDLTTFTGTSTTGNAVSLQLRREVYQAFHQMRDDAHRNGIDIDATEAFRTFEKQRRLRARFGRGAARPGYSEHHLGTTVDIYRGNRPKNFRWLIDHATNYGFVPTMIYEPWHYRYIGRKQAQEFMKHYKKEIVASQRKRLVR